MDAKPYPTPTEVSHMTGTRRERRRTRAGRPTDGTTVPGSRIGGREPGTAAGTSGTPTSSPVPGTDPEPHDQGLSLVPGSASTMREPGTGPYVDIAALLDGELPEPPRPTVLRRTDGNAITYEGQVNLIFGDPESGKTFVCLAAAVESLIDSGRCIVIDLDHNGAPATVRRLLSLGAPITALRDPSRFRYTEPEDRLELIQVVEDMKKFKPTVAVIDSIGELLPLFGSNSNSADEFTAVHTKVLKPLARTGAAVLAIDHLAKGSDSRSQGPGGTAAKRRAIGGVSLRVKVKVPFTPGKGGSAVLTINKDRHGGVRQFSPVGDHEPVAGTFTLTALDDDQLVYRVIAPSADERNEDENAPAADVKEIAALDPPPRTVDEARERLSWRKDRAARAMRTWREREAS